MAYSKIGFHIGAAPNATGYGDYVRALDAAGIPAVCMSVGGEGLGDIVALWDNGSTVEHTAVVRYMPPPGHPDGWQDVPRYDMTPEAAFVRFWAWVKPLIGQEVIRHKDKIVIKMGNELDKGQAEWLAEFYTVGYEVMQSDPDGPFRLGAFSFAAGEPEPEDWRGPKMLDFLRLCAADPIGAAIVLHEYSYADTLQSDTPFKIGRFPDLFAACDENGIGRPYVYIHEWGWEQGTIPGQSEAMAQLPWGAELYAKYPEIKGAGLWSLQTVGGYNDPETGKHISEQVQPMIEPITNYSLTATFPDPPPTDPPNGGNMTTKIKSTVTYGAIEGTLKVRPQRWDGTLKNWVSTGPAFYLELPDGTKRIAIDDEVEEPDEPTDPKPPEFTFEAWPTDYRVVTQAFGNNPDYYGQFNLPGHEGVDIRAPHSTNIYAVASGEVYEVVPAEDGHNYGIRVRIRTGAFRHIYAHMNDVAVAVGDSVQAGQLIGHADDTGNSFGSHLHLTLKHDDAAIGGGRYIGYPYDIIDPTPYLMPFNPEWPGTPPPPPPTGQTYDTSFMRADPGIWRVIRRADGSGEDVWELPLDGSNDVRVKNTSQGEWYFYGNGGVWRRRDTSPAAQADGTERLYMFTEGGQIAPNEATVGVTYSYPNYVQFKAKNDCRNLSENSGPSTSTFLLKEVIENYTFPGTGFTVDWLFVTLQTGETQLYAIHDGRVYGWCGGGAQQANNVWNGELSEVYYDRQIPQQEPPRYCE